jgi:hypothetical protein
MRENSLSRLFLDMHVRVALCSIVHETFFAQHFCKGDEEKTNRHQFHPSLKR